MVVLGGARHLQVELEVGADRVTARLHRRGEGVQRAAQGGQVVGAAAQRGEAGRLGLDADAQFQHRDHVAQRRELLRRDAERRRIAEPDHEGADAVPGGHQPAGLELGDRLAHHGAADAELRHDRRLGGQLVAGGQAAVADAVPQRVDQLERERAGAAARRERHVHVGRTR
ncbi:hypothetical protein X551_03996 [Methylibium sp. T29]|nr:hypothetical protein X551_03996 [Methylibium sp. T29]EWS57726.1 hypothetical protein Y694_04323 [Methylibium sp. T29-B]